MSFWFPLLLQQNLRQQSAKCLGDCRSTRSPGYLSGHKQSWVVSLELVAQKITKGYPNFSYYRSIAHIRWVQKPPSISCKQCHVKQSHQMPATNANVQPQNQFNLKMTWYQINVNRAKLWRKQLHFNTKQQAITTVPVRLCCDAFGL